MNLDAKQIDGKPRRVGTRGDGDPVLELRTKGGLNLIVGSRGGRFETLGAGPHRAVARHIAEKHDKSIKWNDLTKGDWIDPTHFAWLLPAYEELTRRFRACSG
jgi:hypothetical protein